MVKIALLVGVSNYQSDFTSLLSTHRDVKAVEEVLKNPDIGDFDRVDSLLDPTDGEMAIAIENLFQDKNREDLLLLYFGGHGVTDERGNLYLTGKNTSKNSKGTLIKSTALPARNIHDFMRDSRSKHQVIILDCCFSGAFAEGLVAKNDRSIDIESQLGGEGRVILTSSTSLQYSFERKDSSLSIYTQYLVEGLATGAADLDEDGFIYADDLHRYVKQKVIEAEPSMKPEIYAIKEGFRILIARTLRSSKFFSLKQDWGDAPDIPNFFGRIQELRTLEDWIVKENCRLVSIVGIRGVGKTNLSLKFGKGGTGKTNLSVKLTKEIQTEFDYIIWASLLNAPTFSETISRLVKFLSNQQEVTLPEGVEAQIGRLIHYLREQRCLIVLDNFETVIQSNSQENNELNFSRKQYREGYEGYGNLLKKIGELNHRSCLLLTSREEPAEVSSLKGKTRLIRSLELDGLQEYEGRQIFSEIGQFSASDEEWKKLIEFYNGNPLVLDIVARHVNEVFSGNISDFMDNGALVFRDLIDLLDWHFNRLSTLEKELMYWLAINREPISLSNLKENILSPSVKKQVPETLQLLLRCLPIEKNSTGFKLQPVLIEYMTNKLIEQVSEEIKKGDICILGSHAILQATSKDYIRGIQTYLILNPLRDSLIHDFGNKEKLVLKLKNILNLQQKNLLPQATYLSGNLINILCNIEGNLNKYDFSGLTILQAYLQGISLNNTDFSSTTFNKCVFTQTFGSILSMSFSHDSKFLAAGDANGEIHLWETVNYTPVNSFRGHTNWVRTIAFSPNSDILASGSNDTNIILWDTKKNRKIRILKGHKSLVRAVAFNSDGSLLVSACDDKCLIVWDVNNGQIKKIIEGHNKSVESVIFSPDNKTIVSGSEDLTIRIWDVSTGDCLCVLAGHTQRLLSVIISSSGKTIASSGNDGSIRIWNVRTKECIKVIEGHSNIVRSIAFSPDEKILASGSDDKTVKLWDVEQGLCLHTLQGHTNWVRSVAFSADGLILASGSEDQTVRLWQVKDGKRITTFQGYTSWIESLSFSPNGRFLASGSGDKQVRIWDTLTGECLEELQGHMNWVWSVAFSPNGKLLASGSGDNTIRLWDTQTMASDTRTIQFLEVLQGHENGVRTVAFSPDGKLIASGSADQTIRLWNTRTKQCSGILRGHTNSVESVAFNPNGGTIASSSGDLTIKLWDLQTNQCISNFEGHTNWVWSIAFSPDGKHLASGSGDNTIRLWDIETGMCIKILEESTNWVRAVTFSPDGKLLASGSGDSTIRLWDIQTGVCVRTLEESTNWIWSVVFSPDGCNLASNNEDGTIKIWDIQNDKYIRVLTPPRPYEGMKIIGAMGLTESQENILRALGAVRDEQNSS